MSIAYNIVDEVPKLFYRDAVFFWAIFLTILVLGAFIGFYVSCKIKKSNPAYWIYKLWLWGMIIIPIIVGFGHLFCYIKTKGEIEQYSYWLDSRDYIVTKGVVEKINERSNPWVETFIIDGQMFDTNKNSCLLGRRDILEVGKKVQISSHQGIILLVEKEKREWNRREK